VWLCLTLTSASLERRLRPASRAVAYVVKRGIAEARFDAVGLTASRRGNLGPVGIRHGTAQLGTVQNLIRDRDSV